MRWTKPLTDATLVSRYKRFLADVRLADGSVLTVHCPNSGRMLTCSEPGRPVLISDSGNPKRKLRFTLEAIRMGRIWVGVNTANPNRAVEGFVRRGRIPELAGYGGLRREVPYGEGNRSRIDLLLEEPGRRPCYVEVKNNTFRTEGPAGDGYAAFPDAVTERGRKHLMDLAARVEAGDRAVLFYFIGRSDCRRVRPADEIDPLYGETLREVASQGVELLAYRMR
ncbi:MAG: DNA/RNA nuclease SfsA, partial [Acidobacteriota bacterium]